jgi:hypothetical protein
MQSSFIEPIVHVLALKKKGQKWIEKNKSSLDTEQLASGLLGFCPFDQRSARCLELTQRCGAAERRRKQPVHLGWIGILPQRFERAPARLCVEQEVGAFWLLLVRECAKCYRDREPTCKKKDD